MGNYPPMNGEDGVNRLGTSRLEVDEVGVGGMGWSSSFPVVVRLTYRGFLLGNGVDTPDGYETTRTNDSGGCRGGGQFGTGYKPSIRWDIWVDGVGGRDTNGVGCWLNGGWCVGMVSKSKCSMSNS